MKRSRLNPRSKRKARTDREYLSQRQEAHNRACGLCEARCSPKCSVRAEVVHHKAGRGGPDPHRLDNLLVLCKACHDEIHAHPLRAYEFGFMVRRGTENGPA